ncbi:MAG: autotransporter-associated beta strand repeat-containing protein [Kiritimatiellae bacterium]|nr:autotransporter-associated beta strand repeat-containing protein [Kiritimatiellia bacterium]
MNMKVVKEVCLAVALTAMVNAQASVVYDAFDVSHDYDSNGVAGTIWDGFFYNVTGGNTTVAAVDANSSNAGTLTFRTTNGNWEHGDNDGVLLYKTVEGDFDARIELVSMNNVKWHDAGLMARVADPADADAGEDWVAVKHFPDHNSCGLRSTDNSISSNIVEVAGLQPWLRLVRSDNIFISYRSTDGVNWAQISASSRDDMDGLALQVGIWQATFSENEGNAQFDNFSLRLPAVWKNSAGGSWTTAGNWTNCVPAGVADWVSLPGILQSNVFVTLDGDQTAGSIAFATTNAAAYTIGSGAAFSTLTLNDNPGVSGIYPSISVFSGTHDITVPVVVSNGVMVSTSSGTGLKLHSGLSGNGGLTKDGYGTLTLSGTNTSYNGDTVVNGGSLTCLPIPEGVQASYLFDNPDNLGEDSSVNGNDLTASGSPAYSASGKFGGALYLDGNSTLVRSVFPVGVPTGSTPYTIALWEKDNGSGNSGGFLGWGVNSANKCNNIRFDGNNKLIHYWYANDWVLDGLSTDPKDGNWHHIAVTWNGSTQTLYLDGNYVTSIARTGLNAQPANFVIGKTTADANFKGWLDNVQIANRALSVQEIADLVQSGGLENMLPVDTSLQVAEGAMVDLNGSSQTLVGISGDGRITSSSATPVELTVNDDGSNHDFSGSVDGEITLTKTGTGTLSLSGLNAYSGGTFVSEGTLVMSMPSLQDVLEESKVWFDAADDSTLTTNADGVVTSWENKGTAGAALNAEPITPGAGFTVLENEVNGHAVLSLDGTSGMRTANNTDISGSQNRTLFVVGNRKNNGSMFLAHTGSSSAGKAFGMSSETNFLFNYIWSGDILFPSRDNNVYEIYDYMISDGTSSANLISGETVLSDSKSVSANTDNTPLFLGSRFGGVGSGNMAEVIVFDRALTQAERAGVEAYLKTKWFTGDSDSVLSVGAVTLAAGSVLDLDGTSQTLTDLSGAGVVSNGTFTVLGSIAPGGVDSVGALTLVAAIPLSGTLLTDVRLDGTSDLLDVQGSLDLTGLTLQIEDLDELKVGSRYVIARCTPGALTAPFADSNLENSSWSISYNNATGEVGLIGRGLVITIQ